MSKVLRDFGLILFWGKLGVEIIELETRISEFEAALEAIAKEMSK